MELECSTKGRSAILSGVPKGQNDDGAIVDLIAKFVVTSEQAPHLSGREFRQSHTEAWMFPEPPGRGLK